MTPTQKEGLKKLARVMEEYEFEFYLEHDSMTDTANLKLYDLGTQDFIPIKCTVGSTLIDHRRILKLIEK